MDFESAQILGKLIGAGLAMIGAIGAGAGIGIVTSGACRQWDVTRMSLAPYRPT
jgi:F0F1-type ATP synthase membrane subunit c/vacuolar-type H+-ATPase subunit K